MSRLLTTEAPLIVLPSLARELGLEEAIILQQLHYLLGNASTLNKGRTWIYNTLQQWADLLPIPLSRIERAFAKLRKLGIVLVEKLARWKTNRTNYYSIDYDRLSAIVQGSNDLAGSQRITLSDSATPKTMRNASPQNPEMDARKTSPSIPAKSGHVYKENNKDFQQRKNREPLEKPKAKAPAPTPTVAPQPAPSTPEPSPQQQTEVHPLIRSLWQHLRACRIDIAIDDPALVRWQTTGQARDIRQRALDLHMTDRDAWWPAQALAPSAGRGAA